MESGVHIFPKNLDFSSSLSVHNVEASVINEISTLY